MLFQKHKQHLQAFDLFTRADDGIVNKQGETIDQAKIQLLLEDPELFMSADEDPEDAAVQAAKEDGLVAPLRRFQLEWRSKEANDIMDALHLHHPKPTAPARGRARTIAIKSCAISPRPSAKDVVRLLAPQYEWAVDADLLHTWHQSDLASTKMSSSPIHDLDDSQPVPMSEDELEDEEPGSSPPRVVRPHT